MLNIFIFIYNIISEFISGFPFLLTVECISFSLKSCLLILVILHGLKTPKIQRPWFYLLLVLIGAMFSDAAWIAHISQKLFFPNTDYRPILFFIRLAWAWAIVQYQGMSLFIESLVEKNYKVNLHQKLFICISSILCIAYVYFAIFKIYSAERPPFEYTILKLSSLYIFIPMSMSLLLTIKKLRNKSLPKILRKQLKILIQWLIAPILVSDFIQFYPFSFFPTYIASNYAVVSCSTTLLTFAFYYCGKKMIGLRFLNFYNHVQSSSSFNFIDDFKDMLEQLGHVSNVKELSHITQAFFKGAFNIQPSRTMLYLRKIHANQDNTDETEKFTSTENIVENFINRHETPDCSITPFLRQSKILIADELAFNDFYDETDITKEILEFLNYLDADIFLPIYEKNTLIAYVIVERDARINEFYSNIERDEMVVFASYLANIINLLQNRNIGSMIQKDKRLQEELYIKHQEINQYKESIRSFLRDTKQRKIGIIFFKNRRFIYGNQAAKELIQVNLNVQEGHPLTKALYRLGMQVQEYKAGQTSFAKDINGNKLILSAIPNLEQNNIIISVYYPEISDIIKAQIDLLKDPTEWDYLLYLETTQSGKLIKQLIPGKGEHLLNFKIELLKAALSKKALLLEIPDDDLLSMVELLHHISLRETLHILTLQAPESNLETAIKLFGMNPIYGKQYEQALLDKLNNTGTLFIENIHFLDLETQQYLAEFLRYGYYHVFKSDQKMVSNVRIICSTNQNLQTLVQEGRFSRTLLHELNQTTLAMPPLISLPKEELSGLADGFTEQATQTTSAFKNLLELTEKEKNKLINTCPVSLQEFKKSVQQMLQKKSQKNEIFHEIQFDPAYNITDPELIHAARLGKKALKDPKIMAMLMNKFKNQNKVATFLGVNRSSVNRRCKDYNLV